MKALLRKKQIYWPHFVKGVWIMFFGGLTWLINNKAGYAVILYGGIGWSLSELLMGGDENELKDGGKKIESFILFKFLCFRQRHYSDSSKNNKINSFYCPNCALSTIRCNNYGFLTTFNTDCELGHIYL